MIAVIPSIGESPYLPDLLRTLIADEAVSHILLVDNTTDTKRFPPAFAQVSNERCPLINNALLTRKLRLQDRPGQSIYATWNEGMVNADAMGTECAVLNDDIVLRPASLREARRVLRQSGLALCGLNYGKWGPADTVPGGWVQVHGTYRTGGFGGFAFLLAPGAPRVDERFQWWYGDDDLAERIKAAGGTMGVATSAMVEHPSPSLTGNAHSWTQVAAGEDTALFRTLWPTAP